MSEKILPHHHSESEEMLLIRKQAERTGDFQTVADLLKLLGDTTRIRIFWLLCHCEECVMNISAIMDMSSPAVAHHLRLLRNSGLITSRRDGKEVYYRASDTVQSRLLHQITEQVMEIACPERKGVIHAQGDK
ncbi:MAG: metalloregulator ArsR/SmtB family transcription factor [Ruminococcus sp.]|nr:metalloregulator ArsR/SmtB family transcription factor [Ruminococcus sp.]